VVNREWAMCERDDGGSGGRGGIERRGARGGWGGGCKQETCFEILIRGSGRGLEHRDEISRETFEARECSLPS